MGVNFSADFCVKGKATKFEFNRVMRLNGEYTKAQLDGLYDRYLQGKEPEYVTKAMRHATIHSRNSLDEMPPRNQQLIQKDARRQAILGVLQIAQRNLSVDEIVKFVGLDTTHRQVVVDAKKLVEDELIIVGIGDDGARYYRVVGVSA